MNNKVSLQNSAGSHRHAALPQYERSASDLYTTTFDAVERLYKARPHLEEVLAWDSSAGLSHIVHAVKALGGMAVGTELHDHPFSRVAEIHTGIDLFKIDDLAWKPDASVGIINPPYNAADRHISHMLKLGCEVYAILRMNFICAKKRQHLMPHLRAILMVGRQGMLPPGVEDKGLNPSVDYAWFRFTPQRKAADDHGIVLERI